MILHLVMEAQTVKENTWRRETVLNVKTRRIKVGFRVFILRLKLLDTMDLTSYSVK